MLEPIIDRRYRDAYAAAHAGRAQSFRDSFRWVFGRRHKG